MSGSLFLRRCGMWRCGVQCAARASEGRGGGRSAARPCLWRDAGRLRRVGFAVRPAEAHWFCVFHRRSFMGGLRASVFDEAPSVGAADGCALHRRVGRNFAGVRRLGDDVLSMPLCICRRFERKCASLCGWRLVRCARVQGGLSGRLCAGPVARFREASNPKQTFRLLCRRRTRALRRFCRPSYDMRIGFALAGGPVARTAGFAAARQWAVRLGLRREGGG